MNSSDHRLKSLAVKDFCLDFSDKASLALRYSAHSLQEITPFTFKITDSCHVQLQTLEGHELPNPIVCFCVKYKKSPLKIKFPIKIQHYFCLFPGWLHPDHNFRKKSNSNPKKQLRIHNTVKILKN